MSIFRALLISAAVLAMIPSATFAQVRIITPDSEHIYGQGGQLLDDAELRARNERAERAKSLRLREREIAIRQQELDAAEAARAVPTPYYEPYGAQDGSYYGTLHSRQGRHVNLRRIGTAPVLGNSLQFRHASARVRR